MDQRIETLLSFIYGRGEASEVRRRIEQLADGYARRLVPPAARHASLDERDAVLITYGDQLRTEGVPPLRTLHDFAKSYLEGVVSGIHILPFFPYTSDDGFSISDYGTVDPALGDWKDVEALSGSFRLMADIVLNHCSASHPWFRGFRNGEAAYKDYFIIVPPGTDLTQVARPRALPLLTPFETAEGSKEVWTTFSADQVDLNFANPSVLLEMVKVLLEQISHGVQIIRLDAIAYLWKEIGTSCIHHPKTHAVVKLFRAIIDRYAPWVALITETNVPQDENLSYFGDGHEAHLVYQFPLPPLVVDAFRRGDARHLREWAGAIPAATSATTYFNFLASHDGIGLLPARGFLSDGELAGMIAEVVRRGGLISYKATPAGDIPYEMNVSYLDAIAEAELENEVRARKFLASQAVLLSLAGVPGIYVHSLIGSGNYLQGVRASGRNRTINREKLEYGALRAELDREGSLRRLIYQGYRSMLEARRSPAFRPNAGQRVIPAEGPVFALERTAGAPTGVSTADGAGARSRADRVLCLINTCGYAAQFSDRSAALPARATDRISKRTVSLVVPGAEGVRGVELEPWEVLWLDLPA